MKKRFALTDLSGFFALAVFCVNLSIEPSEAAQRPNLVFILADDLGWKDLRDCLKM